MATPTEWAGPFQVNTGQAETGAQDDPQILGLANGSFVVAWEERASGKIGTTFGTDIIAKIYDASGNVLRDAFRLNQVWSKDDEFDFDLTATHDGFAFAAIDRDRDIGGNVSVIYERFDFSGTRPEEIDRVFPVAQSSEGSTVLGSPSIAANLRPENDDTFIVYEYLMNSSPDLEARVFSETGLLGEPFDAAQNSRDFDRAADTAVLSNGNLVTVYEENDSGRVSGEFTIRTSSGSVVGSRAYAVANELEAPKVAALRDGGFVVAYETNDSILMRIFNDNGASQGIYTVEGGSGVRSQVGVTALPDGDFVVVWQTVSKGTLNAQRFNPDGSADGSKFLVRQASVTDVDIGTTGDGRILFSWREAGEVFASIWDPRTTTITPAQYAAETAHVLNSSTITTGVTGTTVLEGNKGDTVYGQGGNDTIISAGSGSYFGGKGNDYFLAGPDTGNGDFELLVGGDGIDTLDVSRLSTAYRVTLTTGNTLFLSPLGDLVTGRESFLDFENVISGAGDDDLVGTDGANILESGAGNDSLFGKGGNDTLRGQGGDDELFGEGENDQLRGGDGDDLLLGGEGNDLLLGEDGNDRLAGGAGEDSLYGDKGDDALFGGAGDDTIDAGAGNDVIEGGTGDDIISSMPGDDTIRAQDGDDLVWSADGDDRIFGGAGNDTVYADNQNDYVDGGYGDDLIRGGNGTDIVAGGAGDDMVDGDGGNDKVRGGAGNDTLSASSGNDTIFGGSGDDLLIGGAGADLLAGGDGEDNFRFIVSHGGVSDASMGAPDTINGFEGAGLVGGDTIDLSGFDADRLTPGRQSFEFFGVQTHEAGQALGPGSLWLMEIASQTRMFGNVDEDGFQEFAVRINDGAIITASDYTAGDFIL